MYYTIPHGHTHIYQHTHLHLLPITHTHSVGAAYIHIQMLLNQNKITELNRKTRFTCVTEYSHMTFDVIVVNVSDSAVTT